MADRNDSAGGRPLACPRCLAMSRDERRLLGRILKRDPEFARRFLETLMRPEPAKTAPQQQKPATVEKETPAAPAKKPSLLDKIEDDATRNLLLKLRKAGVGATGITILYQAVDNLEDWLTGRDAASSAYGVITDNFNAAGDALSSPLVGLGAALGIGFFWGRKAWRQLKKAWKAAGESIKDKVVLANEKVTERIRAIAEFVRSISKTAFVALSCYHLPNLIEAGRSLVEVEPNSNALEQAHQLLNQFFTAAPGTLLPVFAYILAVAAKWLVSSAKGFLEPVNNKRREKMLEEQRLGAEQAATADAHATPSAKPPQDPTPA